MDQIASERRAEFLVQMDRFKILIGIDVQKLKIVKENSKKLQEFEKLDPISDNLSKAQTWNLHLSVLYCYLFGLPPLKRMFKMTSRGSVTYDLIKLFKIKDVKVASEIKIFTTLEVIASARFGLYRKLINILTKEELSTILLGNNPLFDQDREDEIQQLLLDWLDGIINGFRLKLDRFLYIDLIIIGTIFSKAILKLYTLMESLIKNKNYLLIINSSSLLFGSSDESKNRSDQISDSLTS